jgi:hypothetical protein
LKLPNLDQATVSPEKLRGYLLSSQHATGRFKARFFRGLGYSEENWESLSEEFLRIAREGEAEQMPSPFGEKYRILGLVEGPNGRSASLVTIWIVNRGESEPRFVTAYPEE